MDQDNIGDDANANGKSINEEQQFSGNNEDINDTEDVDHTVDSIDDNEDNEDELADDLGSAEFDNTLSEIDGVHITIDGKDFWYPDVSDDVKPKEGTFFRSSEAIEAMYANYALESGFDVRKTTNRKKKKGVSRLRYLVCNREGLPSTAPVDTLNPKKCKTGRRSDTRRTGCRALIRFKYLPAPTNKWILYKFEEMHNYPLISKSNMIFCRSNRQLSYREKSFIYRMSNQNIGATKAHRLFKGIQGGFFISGATVNDFKNYMRDLNCFIGGSDAQMLVDKMTSRMEHVKKISFEYRDEKKQLNALFWADETSKINYKEFGDVVSFDATFRTNRYHMVFVPFTGIDNHKKCVTFGAGLLSREDTDSYTWLLKAFLKAFKKQPLLVLSDQDPAMKKAIETVFPQSNHRLCMWHITSKLTVKVSSEILNAPHFMERFNSLIWNARIDQEQFDKGWQSLLNYYKLNDNKWLNDMYGLRHFWIPAFFRGVPLSGLMRTTSRSESENSAFHQNTHYGSTLVNFMNSFESAMEKQRHKQSELDFKTNDRKPRAKTPLLIEVNALKYYTKKVYRQVQNEILRSVVSCSQFSVTETDGVYEIIVIEYKNRPSSSMTDEIEDTESDNDDQWDELPNDNQFKVTYNRNEETFVCACMKFEHFGVLCHHIFCVMKTFNIDDIPPKYILRRWRKDIIPTEMLRRCFRYGDSNHNVEKTAIDIFSSVDHCVSFLSHDQKKLDYYLQQLKLLETKMLEDLSLEEQPTKNKEFEQFLGVSTPAVVEIENPGEIRNKGCGNRKRIKSSKEISINKSAKPPRSCTYCHTPRHDWRNCPVRKEDEKNTSAKESPATNEAPI